MNTVDGGQQSNHIPTSSVTHWTSTGSPRLDTSTTQSKRDVIAEEIKACQQNMYTVVFLLIVFLDKLNYTNTFNINTMLTLYVQYMYYVAILRRRDGKRWFEAMGARKRSGFFWN